MDWQAINDQLPGIVALASGDTTLDVYWADQPQGYRADLSVRLDVVGVATLGRDGPRYIVSQNGQELTEEINGPRTINIQIQADVDNQILQSSAWETISRIKAGFRREDVVQRLLAIELGFQGSGNTFNATYTSEHNRRRSACTIEVTFNAFECLQTHTIPTVGELHFSSPAEVPVPDTTVVLD